MSWVIITTVPPCARKVSAIRMRFAAAPVLAECRFITEGLAPDEHGDAQPPLPVTESSVCLANGSGPGVQPFFDAGAVRRSGAATPAPRVHDRLKASSPATVSVTNGWF